MERNAPEAAERFAAHLRGREWIAAEAALNGLRDAQAGPTELELEQQARIALDLRSQASVLAAVGACARAAQELDALSIGRVGGSALDIDAIEGRAENALSQVPGWLWDGTSLPVPVESIADSHFSLLVRDVDDLSEAPGFPQTDPSRLSGLLLTALGEIWVNADEARQWPPRRRFTIAHELGHWVMHRSGQQSLFCRHASGEGEVPGQLSLAEDAGGAGDSQAVEPPLAPPPIPLEEEEANAFSAAVLMPRDLFLAEHRRSKGDVALLQDCFGCSEKATLRRIATLAGG